MLLISLVILSNLAQAVGSEGIEFDHPQSPTSYISTAAVANFALNAQYKHAGTVLSSYKNFYGGGTSIYMFKRTELTSYDSHSSGKTFR